MRKQVFGRQFKRDVNERQALFKSLMSALILHERIQTTEEKAKAIKGDIEKLVTRVKKKGDGVGAVLYKDLTGDAIEKLVKEIAPRFTNRPGGYTRIIHAGNRVADNAHMVIMEWVEKGQLPMTNKKVKKDAKAKGDSVEDTTKIEKKASKAKEEKKKEPKKSTKAKEQNNL